MRRPGPWTRKRWIALGVIVALIGAIGVFLAGPERDPWPPRLVIPGPQPGEGSPWGYTPDGRSYRTSGEAGVTSWDATTGQRGVTVPPPFLWRRALSSDGRRFIGWIGADFAAAEIVVVDATTEKIEQRFPVQSVQGTNLAFRDGDRSIEVVLGNRQQVMAVATWDLASGVESRRTIEGPGKDYTRPVAYSPNGRIWAYLDCVRDGIQLWDPAADRPIGGLLRTPTTERNLFGWRWTDALFTRDNRTLLTGRADGQVEFWDVRDGHLIKLVRLHPGGATPMNMQIAPDGRTLLSTGNFLPTSSRVRQEWERLCSLITGEYPADARLETVVLDLATDRVLARASRVRGVGFSPDSRTVVTWGAKDWKISFRDIPQPEGR